MHSILPKFDVRCSMFNVQSLRVLLAACFILSFCTAWTPNWFDPVVVITNMKVTARDAKTAAVTFDVSWDDSWRHDINHDAAWLFFKVKPEGATEWQPVRLAADRVKNPTGYSHAKISPLPATEDGLLLYHLQGRKDFSKPGGLERYRDFFSSTQYTRAAKRDQPGLERYRDFFSSTQNFTPLEFVVPDGPDGFTGVFLRRAENGAGLVTTRGVTVLWDLQASKGITDPAKAQIRAFGIEMVYVPAGSFYLGSGGTEVNAFYSYSDDPTRSLPYRVTGPGAIPTGRKPGRLWSGGASPEDGGELPASFPNGYAAFYCMKNHITPRQYAAFLNMLPAAQADERYAGHERALPTTVGYSGTNGGVKRKGTAPNYTYEFWAGGGRGGAGCFAICWADGATYAAWAGLRPMTELELEKAVRGPREPWADEGASSYWGVRELSCFKWGAFKGDPQTERPVTVANATGRAFKGTHGLGIPVLPADWPQADAVGTGFRCTHYVGTKLDLERVRVSDRIIADLVDPTRIFSHKWRGVRTVPPGID